MSYQFVHENCYARTASKKKSGGHSIRTVIAEVKREDGAHPHVDAPLPPQHLYGVSLDEVERLATEYADNAKDASGRKLRSDAVVLLAGVVSASPNMTDEQWIAYRDESIETLHKRYGRCLLNVTEHLDEYLREPPANAFTDLHRHIHYYCVPEAGMRFDALMPARAHKQAAEKAALAAGVDKKQAQKAGNDAFKRERRQFQDWWYETVARRHGLTRIGPRRERLSRGTWVARVQQRQRDAQERRELEALTQTMQGTAARASELAEEAKRRACEAAESEQAARRAQAEAAEVVAASARQAELAAAAVAEQRRAERRAERVRRVAAGRQQQAELAKRFARPIERDAQRLRADREALTRERRELAESRQRWERAGARVGAVVAAVREVVAGPVRRLRERIESMQREHAAAVREAKAAGRVAGRDEREQEVKGLTTVVQRLEGDNTSLRKRLDEADELLRARRDMAPRIKPE